MLETQTNKSASKLSGGTTRRSRKDRSGVRTKPGRNAVTPHVFCSLKGQQSMPTGTTNDVSPLARMIPGSDTISLELDIKGMNKPNKPFNEDGSCDRQQQQQITVVQTISPIAGRTRN